MTEFTKQYAIRLPNGLLHAHTHGQWMISEDRCSVICSRA